MKHIDAALQAVRHAARLRGAVACATCGYAWIEALVAGDPVVCAECHARERGVATTENHHLAGRANSPVTVRLSANEHRILTSLQRAWPTETLRNVWGDPRLIRAAWLRGVADLLYLIARSHEMNVPRGAHRYGEQHEV